MAAWRANRRVIMSAEDAASPGAGWPDQEHTGAGLQHAQRGSRTEKNYLIRPVMRCVTLVGGALGTTGASLSGHQLVAISTLLVTAAIIVLELWIAKRRDDVFSKVATKAEADVAVLRAITVHEAVRSGLLSSEDTVRILRTAPNGQHDEGFARISQPNGTCGSPIEETTSPTFPRAPRIAPDPPESAA
jgi:hypothetical protein